MFNKALTPSALSLWHLFAIAVLLFTASPMKAANIPMTEDLANAVNPKNNLPADQRSVRGDVLLRGQAVIDMVPMADRTAFIRYELSKAMQRSNFTANNSTGRAINPRFFLDPNILLSPTQLVIFENIPTYPEFANDLLFWLRDRLEVAEDDIYGLLSARTILLCTANGICIPDDRIGDLCCPF
ncbi:uncharacterized protein LOC128862589 isoform X2 [Anastrepha ludens]|nr:uncharacterized protein LOC128862589 isoform X2 [Anastrepha ludens]